MLTANRTGETMPEDPLSRASVLAVLQDLIRIPSINPTLSDVDGAGEAAIAEFARDWLERHGVRAWTEEAAPGRPNTVGEVGGDDGDNDGDEGGGPTLVLCAHLDTVAVDGMTIDAFEPAVEGDRVYGRGSYDMKCGAAACMSAAAALAAEDLPGRLMLALVADEEYASVGARDFVARHGADACILTEPSEGRLILGHKGFVWASIRFDGTAAHGSRWDLGESAIGKAAAVVTALETFDRESLRARVDPLVGPASLHCSLIEGGSGISTYAHECTLKVERRTIPGETCAQVLDELRGVIAAAGQRAEPELLLERRPMTTPADAPIAVAVREAATSVTGATPADGGVAYWMDAAIFHEAGIPTVDIGPSGEGAHAAVEWADIDSVVVCARTLAEAARRFFASARDE
jgi:acetylornithine deacetylase